MFMEVSIGMPPTNVRKRGMPAMYVQDEKAADDVEEPDGEQGCGYRVRER